MATGCELAGIGVLPNTDFLSFLPALLGQARRQKEHKSLYWEFYEKGSAQAVRWGKRKGVYPPGIWRGPPPKAWRGYG